MIDRHMYVNICVRYDQQREMEMDDMRMRRTKRTMATKDPIKEPEVRSQKLLNCWQMANQLAEVFPLCAKYTIAAAAEAAAVKKTNATYKFQGEKVSEYMLP